MPNIKKKNGKIHCIQTDWNFSGYTTGCSHSFNENDLIEGLWRWTYKNITCENCKNFVNFALSIEKSRTQ